MDSIFLSVLIPVYNWDLSELLQRLAAQVLSLSRPDTVEIVVMDDGSSKRYEIDSSLLHNPIIRYHAFAENRGRAAIRRQLLQEARGEYVLFLDADMLPDDDRFLHKYIEYAEAGSDIVCGGISYRQCRQKGGDYSFYLYKSSQTEVVAADRRRLIPWRYLFTSNVMVRRQVARTVPFDSRFAGYGFEDIEWALRLSALYKIEHIDNACTHMGLQTKKQAFSRMRQSIDNYVLFLSLHPRQTAASPAVKVTRLLSFLPISFLHGLDRGLTRVFTAVRSDHLSFLIYQCDKMILLTKALKRNRHYR